MTPVFGIAPPEAICWPRPAAYAVLFDKDGKVAVVRGKTSCWLPGGGSLAGESPEDTIHRELCEELGRSVRLVRRIGEAVQYFDSADDACWYRMTAVFFFAEFTVEPLHAGEHERQWLDARRDGGHFFHACHAWAVSQVLPDLCKYRKAPLPEE